jgi:hypothetical protein
MSPQFGDAEATALFLLHGLLANQKDFHGRRKQVHAKALDNTNNHALNVGRL